MDRRFLLWLVLCFLLIQVWQTWVMPPPKRPARPAPQENKQQVANEEAELDHPPRAGDAEGAAARDAAVVKNAQPGELPLRDGGQLIDDVPPQPLRFVTLGSLDPDSPYRMLVTLSSQGAGVRRIELASLRYRELDDRSGYAGHLELAADGEKGLLVGVVGPGSPAAKAKLQSGDRIVGLIREKEEPIATVDAWRAMLARTKPGQTLTLRVRRGQQTMDVKVELARRPLETIRPESENILVRNVKLPPDFSDTSSFLTTLHSIGDVTIEKKQDEIAGVALLEENWELVEQTPDSVQFRRIAPHWGLEFLKTYRLSAAPVDRLSDRDFPAYDLKAELTIRNVGGQPRQISYQQDGPNGLPVEGWWYAQKVGRSSGVGLRDVVGRYFGADPQQQGAAVISQGKAEEFQGGSMAWAGVDAQYFSVVMLPDKENVDSPWIDRVVPLHLDAQGANERTKGIYSNVTCRLISQPQLLQPGGEMRHAFRIYNGPKRPPLLAKYRAADDPNYALSDLAYYGWPIFGNVAHVMLAILHFFYDIVGNYGLAIIMLTVLVRGCMFPISRGQAKSMARMQELRPEMERIKEKYKGDQQKYAQAIQELYRKNGVNPLAGCLPMLIQLPIFMGLYRCLAVDVELRQAPLLGEGVRWCSNLAAPDMLLDWSSFMPGAVTRGEGFFGLGPYLNVLPLVTIGLFLLQQKLFMPPATNEQGEMQQKMMKYMMVFMGLMFYKVPSGLCIYFIASSLWGIAERKFVPPATAPIVKAPDVALPSNSPPQRNKNKRRR